MLEKFAEELKTARQNSQITLQQIAGKTRIDLKFLEYIEKGNFTFLPELYIKAFITEYARIVGLDEKLTIEKYEAAKQGKPYEKKETTGNKSDDKIEAEQYDENIKGIPASGVSNIKPNLNFRRQGSLINEIFSGMNKNMKIIITISAGIVLLFVVIYFTFLNNNSQIIVSEKPYEQVLKENKQRFEKEKAVEYKKPSGVNQVDSLSLLMHASDTSWVKIIMDGKHIEEFTLYPNTRKKLKALTGFIMTIGNSGAMSFSLNKKPLNFKGKNKRVEYISIDSTGLKYLNSPPQFNN